MHLPLSTVLLLASASLITTFPLSNPINALLSRDAHHDTIIEPLLTREADPKKHRKTLNTGIAYANAQKRSEIVNEEDDAENGIFRREADPKRRRPAAGAAAGGAAAGAVAKREAQDTVVTYVPDQEAQDNAAAGAVAKREAQGSTAAIGAAIAEALGDDDGDAFAQAF